MSTYTSSRGTSFKKLSQSLATAAFTFTFSCENNDKFALRHLNVGGKAKFAVRSEARKYP